MSARRTNPTGGLFTNPLLLCVLIAVFAFLAVPYGGQEERDRQRPRRVVGAEARSPAANNSNTANEEAAFAQVATEIGTQYSLGYYSTNKARDGQFRAIRVELRGLQGKPEVRAREGYYAPKQE